MSYKWQKEDWEYPLDDDERIIDWSYIAEQNFTLAALLTSKGGVRIYCNVGSNGIKRCVTHLHKIAAAVNEAAAVCVLPDASGLAFILTKGSVLLVPLRCILDVPWGRCDILANDTISVLEVDGVEEGCLCTPTTALCYSAVYSKRPFLIYANKAGQLFIIDLTIMAVSVILRAPESIHDIALYLTKNNAYLLVSGFTGEQWILPLETNGRGLRETLGQVIPWDLKDQHRKPSRISVAHDGVLAVLDSENCIVRFYGDSNMDTVKDFVNVPKNTWQIHAAPRAVFAVTDQGCDSGSSVHFGGLFGMVNVSYEKVADFPDEKILGFIPILCENILPSCLIVTEHDLIALSPKKSLWEVMVGYVAELDYSYDICKMVAGICKINAADLVQYVFEDTASNIRNLEGREIILNKLIRLALDSSTALVTLIQWCSKYDFEELLVEVVKDVCAEDPSDESRHHMISLCMARYKAHPQDRDKIESVLNEFLVQHSDVHTGMEQLCDANFWTSIAIIVDNSLDKAEAVGKYLAAIEKEWPSVYSSFIVKILASLCWKMLSKEDSEILLRRMTDFIPHLRSTPHLTAFANIATEQLTSYPSAAAILYVLSLLRLIESTHGSCLTSPAVAVISSGSNCTAVVTSEEAVGFWGEFSAGAVKAKHCDKSREQRISRLNVLDIPARVYGVSCGTEHLLCLTNHGKVYAFGRNRFGQCGVGHTDDVIKATEIVGSYGCARTISAGHYHSALIDDRGCVFTWGWSFHGQLGLDSSCSFKDISVPHLVKSLNGRVTSVACGYAHTLFLMESGVVYSCGNGSYGQLGAGVEVKKRFDPEVVPLPERITMIASKYFHCLAVTETQKIYCWGINPQILKMKMLVKRRLRAEADRSSSASEKRNDKLAVSQAHLAVSQVEHMVRGKIVHIDAGYSHSALINDEKNLFTWGKGLDMQLGHGNKKEQEEPHQLFEPAATAWDFVSCGYDFTTAVTSGGTVYVWGRNYKGHLGVETGISPPTTRKIVFKTSKGPSRTIEVGGDTPCLSRPTKFPSVIAFSLTGTRFDEVRKRNFIAFLKKLDSHTISVISSRLLRDPVYCLPAVYVHLLADDLVHAAELLIHIPSEEIEKMADNNNISEENALPSLIDIIWDLICKHPSFTVQSKAVTDMLSSFALGDRVVKSKKLSCLALLLFSKPELLSSLDSAELLKILEKWQPDPSAHGLQVSQDSLQSYSGKVRYWTCCGAVEKCGGTTTRSSGSSDKRRICPKCCEKWSYSVRAKLHRCGNDTNK